PLIRPLGFDWKIGIALITSFAAREVFVGTMSTLYSVGSEDEARLTEKLSEQKRADGTPVFTLGVSVALMLFYAFAMQCMSTFAVVKRETQSWWIPLAQFAYMTILAWGSAFLAYVILS
ncbi:MAG: nucleoside recognition domain-containing protein, partial [Flavobacteriales bacterium]